VEQITLVNAAFSDGVPQLALKPLVVLLFGSFRVEHQLAQSNAHEESHRIVHQKIKLRLEMEKTLHRLATLS